MYGPELAVRSLFTLEIGTDEAFHHTLSDCLRYGDGDLVVVDVKLEIGLRFGTRTCEGQEGDHQRKGTQLEEIFEVHHSSCLHNRTQALRKGSVEFFDPDDVG